MPLLARHLLALGLALVAGCASTSSPAERGVLPLAEVLAYYDS